MTEAVIQATFADYKRIKTRKVAQLVFEVPLELLHDTIAKLGGEPSMHEDTWCAIARLELKSNAWAGKEINSETAFVEDDEDGIKISAAKPKREMTLANKIGALCDKKEFQDFLIIKHREKFMAHCRPGGYANTSEIPEIAAKVIRDILGVKSRSEIEYDTAKAFEWKTKIYEPYEAWLNSSLLKGEER